MSLARVDPEFTASEVERGLRLGIVDGIFSNGMFTLCSGAILAALAIFAGLSDFDYGLLAAMPFLAQLLQLPAVVLYRRFHHRKAVTIAFATTGRLAILLVVAALLWFPPGLRGAGIFAGFLAWSAFGAVAGGSWLWWMRDLVPEARLGRYFGTRAAFLVGLSAPLLLGAGLFIDHQRAVGGPEGERFAFATVYVLAALFGVGSSLFLSLMPHRPPREDPSSVPLREVVRAPFADSNFRAFLRWQTLWGFGATVSVPFFPLFLLVDHGLSVSLTTALLIVGYATNVLFFWLWGRLSDRYGNKPVLAVAVPVFAAGLLLTLFVPHDRAVEYVLVVVIQVLFAIGTSAADLTSWNLAFKLARGPSTPAYLSATLLTRAVATGVGPILGGVLGAYFLAVRGDVTLPTGGAGTTLFSMAHLQFVFVLGAILVLASARPLTKVREAGEAPRAELLDALRAEAMSGALYPGVRHFALASSYLIRAVVKGEEIARGAMPGTRRNSK